MRRKNCFFLFSKDFKGFPKYLDKQNIHFDKYYFAEQLKLFIKCYISIIPKTCMDYKKKSLSKLSNDASYEEIDTRLASGWYVDSVDNTKKKKYRTKEVSFKISKKI